MFKVGDIIVNKYFRKERYTILEIHPERTSYAVMIEPFPDIVDVVKPYYIGIDTMNEHWDYDDSYYRKKKLERINQKMTR
jgi:hypothetical protein